MDIWLEFYADVGGQANETIYVYKDSITHSLLPILCKTDIYTSICKSAGELARDISAVLEAGIADMKDKPKEYIKLYQNYGWGKCNYDSALYHIKEFARACREYPRATIGMCNDNSQDFERSGL